MFRPNPKYVLPLVTLTLSLVSGGKLMAQTCNDVEIKIVNNTGDEIKVKKFEYHDIDKGMWKTETGIFGVDGFDKLEPRAWHEWTRNLGFQDKMNTEFRVTYAHHVGGSKWGSDKVFITSKFLCTDKMKQTLTLTN